MTDEEKADIDGMSLAAMLHEWRFAPIGHFQTGEERTDYFVQKMNEKRARDPREWTRASKAVGW